MFCTASKKRRPDHLRPRTGYGGNPNSVFRTPTPCNDTLRQTANGARLGKSFTSPRIPCSLTWRLPLRVAERVDVGICVKCTNQRELVISVSAPFHAPCSRRTAHVGRNHDGNIQRTTTDHNSSKPSLLAPPLQCTRNTK